MESFYMNRSIYLCNLGNHYPLYLYALPTRIPVQHTFSFKNAFLRNRLKYFNSVWLAMNADKQMQLRVAFYFFNWNLKNLQVCLFVEIKWFLLSFLHFIT